VTETNHEWNTCLYCGEPTARPTGKTCGKPECRNSLRRDRLIATSVERKAKRLEKDPLPKCMFCDEPVSRHGAATCGSKKCHSALKRKHNATHRSKLKDRPRHVDPLPKCMFCERQVSRRGAKICGLVSCRTKLRQENERIYHAAQRREGSKTGFSLDQLRKYFGMTPIVKTKIRCYRCRRWFVSENPKKERHCEACRKQMAAIEKGSLKEASFYEKKHRAGSGA